MAIDYFVSYFFQDEKTTLGFGSCIITLKKFDLAELKAKLDVQANINNILKFYAIPLTITKIKDLK